MLTKRETSIVEADALLPTKFGEFRIRAFHDPDNNKEHALLTWRSQRHHWCVSLRVPHWRRFGSLDAIVASVRSSMKEIQEHGSGAMLPQAGRRGIGLTQNAGICSSGQGLDTLDANLQLASRRCKNLRNSGENAHR